MQAKEIKRRLILGFSVMLLLIVVLLIVGLSSMWSIESRLKHIVGQYNAKTDLVMTMRHTARERTISLYKMLVLTSKIERKDEQKPFNEFLARYAEARKKLMAMRLTADERALLDTEQKISEKSSRLQDQVANLLVRDQVVIAQQLLYNEALPIQIQIIEKLEALLLLQRQANFQTEKEAGTAFQNSITLIMLLGGSAILIGVIVALIVIKRTTLSETRLFREKERAQVTLHSIGEGVITTDASGKVDYINLVAQELTECTREDANGKPLLEVFKLVDEEGNAPDYDPIQRAISITGIVDSSAPMMLYQADGNHYAIEYTVAPIRDFDSSVLGTVVVFRNVTAIRDMMKQMDFQAKHDSLTGLVNRREFERRLDSALNSAREQSANHILCYMDLDQFKVINDTCGHIAGDEFLKQLAQLLEKNIRRTDTLSRLGGDEFGLLLRDCKLAKATQIVDELRKSMSDYRFVWQDKSFEIGVSIGVVEINSESGRITELLSAADAACFVAKDLGRNRYHLYQPDDEALAQRRNEMQWLPRIRRALEVGQFKLYQQRIMPLKKTEVAQHFYEFLLRMYDDDEKIVPPSAFVPAAERYDLMPTIDRWIVTQAFEHIKSFTSANPKKSCLWTINLSGLSLCDETFYEFVNSEYYKTQIDSSCVCFEVTETAAVTNLSSASTMINKLKAKGFKFALDDFGSGLSSFTYLKNLSVDFLKIDGSFVKDMATDPIDRAMVESINQIGHIMGLKTIAEYVEDADALQHLKDIGVDFAQGFWLHEPEPIQINQLQVEKVN